MSTRSGSAAPQISGKRVLVTGCCGTVGRELVAQLLGPDHAPIEVTGVDNDESGLFLLDQLYLDERRAGFFLCDVRDEKALRKLAAGVDVIFHCAAFKHVVMCERSPMESVQTNILGVQNVIHAAIQERVGRVIFTSSDKAVNPTSVMGTSKLMGERLITAANSGQRELQTIFASTRFGNVLGSNGSVVPVFRRQIAAGGPLTLTDPEMTRFVMSTNQAVRLVIDSAEIACGGEVFITKMPAVRIADLARVMIERLAPGHGHDPKDIEIRVIGPKSGEKLYEELMSPEETRRALELERYFCVLPAFRSIYRQIDYSYADVVTDKVTDPYVSADEQPLSAVELQAFLHRHGLLNVEPAGA